MFVRDLKNTEVLFKDVVSPHYSSYKFTKSGVPVFNPLSITKFLVENPKDPVPYWAQEVQYRILMTHTVKKYPYAAFNLLFDEERKFPIEKLREVI